MENENIPQPLDALIIKLGLTNADLVKASTEQLSFKMVQKARKGRRLKPRMQDKILKALLAAKPDLKLNRRDLFRYDIGETAVKAISNAMALSQKKKINYPQYVDLLMKAGITRYTVEVATNRTTFFGTSGEAHVIQGPVVSPDASGLYDEDALRSAIADAQKHLIDYADFLKKIRDAGIMAYEVNIRSRRIVYKGETQSYRENIPQFSPESPAAIALITPQGKKAPTEKPKRNKPALAYIKTGKKGKFIKKHRVKKRRYHRA